MDGRRVLGIYEKMVQDRGNMPELWDEVIRYCFPQETVTRPTFGGDANQNGWRRVNPVCSYPVVFTNRLGSSIHANAFPASDYWFDLTVIGEDLTRNTRLRDWCRKARDTIHFKIRQGTNFYQESHAMMIGLAALGTAGFYTYYKNGSLHFRYVPIHNNLYIASNSDGEVDTVAVLHSWTAKEAIEEYGYDNVGVNVQTAFNGNGTDNQRFDYIQLVYPKTTYGEKYGKNEKPVGDVTVEKETGRVVKVSGHSVFPFAVPRFLVYSDDLYGRSPAMNAMPDIRAINALRKNLLDATARAIKPALFMNTMVGNVSTEAGALNRNANFDPKMIWSYPTPTDFPAGKDQFYELIESLKAAFFIDVFTAIDNQKYMTATEVYARQSQKVEAISPIVTRIQKEFSSRVILTCLNLLIDAGEIEPPPNELRGKPLKIGFISSLDAMIQQGIASKTMNFLSQVAVIADMRAKAPDAISSLNVDRIIQSLGDANNLPADFFLKPEEIEAQRMAAAEQQRVMAQAQVDNLNSQSFANMAKANKEQELIGA